MTEENRKILHTDPITDRLVPCPVKKPADDPNNDCATLHGARARHASATGETGYDVEFDRVIDQPGKPDGPPALPGALPDAAEHGPGRDRAGHHDHARDRPKTTTTKPKTRPLPAEDDHDARIR